MNQTTEGSKKWQVIAGGQTIPLEDGKIDMPPKNADRSDEVVDNIIIGNFQEIKVGTCRGTDILSNAQIIELKKYREERKTKKALERLAANQR